MDRLLRTLLRAAQFCVIAVAAAATLASGCTATLTATIEVDVEGTADVDAEATLTPLAIANLGRQDALEPADAQETGP